MTKTPSGVRHLLPNGWLRTVLATWFAACVGEWAFNVALAVFAFDRAGVAAVGIAGAARLLPAMVAAPFSGALIDRGARGRTVGLACLVQAAALGGAGAIELTHGPLAGVIALGALAAIAATALRPGLQTLLPALAQTPEELTRATAIWTAVDNGGFLLGSALAGASIPLAGTGPVSAGAGAMAALGGLAALRLPALEATPLDDPEEDAGAVAALAGVRALRAAPLLRAPLALLAGLLLLEGTSDVQLVALALRRLHLASGGPGLLYAVWGAGGMMASGVSLWLVRRRGYGLALIVGALVFAVSLGICGYGGPALAIAAMIPAGAGYALVENSVMALVARLADDAVAGRVYALSELLYAGAAGVGALLAAPLIAVFGIAGSLAAVGIAYGIGALLAWRSCTAIDSGQEEATRVRELLRAIPFLTPVPLPRLERLVRGARRVEIPAGETVFAAGEEGDSFYAIERGSVLIREFGRIQGPRTGFGEIALLRAIPRTATVLAETDVVAWALRRRAFLAAVAGHPEATRAADSVVDEHLARPPADPGSPVNAVRRSPD